MSKRALGLATAAGLMLAVAGPLAAQAWDAPSFLAPRQQNELGAAFIVPEDSHWGLVGLWRRPGRINLGLRGGYIDLERGDDDDGAGIVGADVYGMLVSASDGGPADLAWTAGLGGTFGDDVSEIRVPVGVAAGLGFPIGSGLSVYPYVNPRIGIDIDLEGDVDAHTGLSIDVGADVGIGRHLLLRLAGTVVDRPAWGIGLSWVRGRKAPVTAN